MTYQPNYVIVHVVTNEIPTMKTAKCIANDIMKVCNLMKNENNSACGSGISYRKGVDGNIKAEEANKILKLLCRENQFMSTDNRNISPRLLLDGIYLTKTGDDVLFNNFVKCSDY